MELSSKDRKIDELFEALACLKKEVKYMKKGRTILFKIETDNEGIGFEHILDEGDAEILPHVITILETAKLEIMEIYKNTCERA